MNRLRTLWITLWLAVSYARADDEGFLGELLFKDVNLSLHRNQSCASCHSLQPSMGPGTDRLLSAPGFVDPDNVHLGTPVSNGSVEGRNGVLNAPGLAYAAFSPAFHWSAEDETYVGGQFWNGRSADLQSQATQPFLNPSEMAMPSLWAVVTRIKDTPAYEPLFESVFGIRLRDIPGNELAPASLTPPPEVVDVFKAAAQAISEFERSPEFHKFNSKFDFWLAGRVQMTPNEVRGMTLFNSSSKANCAACHPTLPGRDLQGRLTPPLLTDFTYDNIGLPRNNRIPGRPDPDPGLAGRAEILQGPDGDGQWGKHKVMTLRNIALTPPYGHNGVLKSLEQVVHFYNTRDILGRVESDLDAGFGVMGWPLPEIPRGINEEELGDLQLTLDEESDIVAFLKTLTDDYPESGEDPSIPPGTPSPFADYTPPVIPVQLAISGPDQLTVTGHLGRNYLLESAESPTPTPAWSTIARFRLSRSEQTVDLHGVPRSSVRFFRVVEAP